jgi:hypothetical protein
MKSLIRFVKIACIGLIASIAIVVLEDRWQVLSFIIVFLFILYVVESIEKINKTRLTVKGEKPMCYRIKLTVSPKWEEILAIPLTDKDQPYRAINRIRTDPDARIGEWSIFGKEFSYVVFVDELSGLNQIWSQTRNEFTDDMEEGGRVGGHAETLENKYGIKTERLSKVIIISPWCIAFGHDFVGMDMLLEKEQILSEIPYGLIIKHLKRLYRAWGDAMKGVLKFPQELQEAFSQYGVKYETWDNEDYGTGIGFTGKPIEKEWARYTKKVGFEISHDKMKSHVFSTRHYHISVNIKFYDRDNSDK